MTEKVGRWWWRLVLALVLLLGAGLLWRWGSGPATPPGAAKMKKPPARVEVVRSVQRDLPKILRLQGLVTPDQLQEVRPQSAGVVSAVRVREGETVRAGQVLFELEAAAEQAELARARAQRAKDAAQASEAQRVLQRNQQLLAQNFIAPAAVETNRQAWASAQALVQADEAQIHSAEVALAHKTLRAGISGRAGALNVFPGSVVNPSMNPPMLTLTQMSPISVSMALPEKHLAELRAAAAQGTVPVQVQVPASTAVLPAGQLRFIDSTVDSRTGTVRLKAHWPNADAALWPGAYVEVSLQVGWHRQAVVLPVAAVQTGPEGSFAYWVDAEQKIRQQRLVVQDIQQGWAVVQGVPAGVQVVTQGALNVRPGDRVSVVDPAGVPPEAAAHKHGARPRRAGP